MSESTPGTNGWFAGVERRLSDVEKDIGYLMHPENGVHAKVAKVQQALSKWAIAILTALLMNLIGVIVTLTFVSKN